MKKRIIAISKDTSLLPLISSIRPIFPPWKRQKHYLRKMTWLKIKC